jgi:microcin C transport system substrate-binding protein
MRRYLLSTILFVASTTTSLAAAIPQHAIAMHGAPKYVDGYTHFDYVNADAPKSGALRLNANGSFDSTNPFIVIGQPAAYLTLVYESLMTRSWDEPFSLYGLLAESIETPDDRSSIVFNLNTHAHFSDGQPVTAEDVLFSFITLRDKGRPNHRTYYKKVVKAEKIGERSVKFTFAPDAAGKFDREMPLIMGLMPIMPEHIWKGRDFNKTTLEIPVGSGPYKVSALDAGHTVTYARDENYWGRDLPAQRGLYNFNTIHIDYYRDENIALEAFMAGRYDLRREYDANRWATAYDFPAAHDGRVKLEKFAHHRPEPAEGFVFNTRRTILRDPALREALEYTFDSGWINRNLFHSQYHRIESFFPNSELAAPPLPNGKELEILQKYKAQLPAEIFVTPVAPPATDGSEEQLRANLLAARDILRKAHYIWRDGKLYAPQSTTPVTFEILLNDFTKKKVALVWARTLARVGITANVRMVDSAEYQARLNNFDFDVAVYKWINSLSPGNEQVFFWGSAAANQKGSRNYAGVHNPAVDALANAISNTTTREDLVATAHALDRVLMAGHYTIPFFYQGSDAIAYWTQHVQHPQSMPLYGTVMESWWWE